MMDQSDNKQAKGLTSKERSYVRENIYNQAQ